MNCQPFFGSFVSAVEKTYRTFSDPSSHWLPSSVPLLRHIQKPEDLSMAEPVGQLHRKKPRTWVSLHLGYTRPKITNPKMMAKITVKSTTLRMWMDRFALLHDPDVLAVCHDGFGIVFVFSTLISF